LPDRQTCDNNLQIQPASANEAKLMNQPDSVEEAIFHAAQQIREPDMRDAYLEKACTGNSELRRRIERLLHAGDRAKEFFERNAPELRPELSVTLPIPSALEAPGCVLGRYKLLQQIGEGGCGVVYMAEQEEPVRRRVALKVIKLGMDTKQVIARFEAERQALAMMDHPNIAKVFDAGTTGGGKSETRNPKPEANPKLDIRNQTSEIPAGRPYFVMELVRGIKITDYCDQHHLSTRERLELFIQVCHAIQHAHQKGIIHRDIKPSNILVSLHDDVPVPKVIDFGIAKAIEQKLTDKTLFTAFEQFLGTPAYMSPEQAGRSDLDVDTRSDIYALGVLLYELLTGLTPFDAKTLLSAGVDEMRRIIREQEPVRPSTRLRQTRSAPPASPKAPLASRFSPLATDLDWIVMKCLEKDRTRRYETASGLAQDLERHLKHEPVAARSPSTTYRVEKFVRRNKVMVSSAAAVAAALVLGVVGSTWQAVRATRAELEQSRQRQRAQENEQRAEQARAREEAQRRMAEQQYYCASIGQVQALLEQGQYGRAKHILAQTNLAAWRGWEWGWLERNCNLDLMTLSGEGARLTGVVFSPDGRWMAAGSNDGAVRLWDAETGVARAPWREHSGDVVLLDFSPDSRRLVTASFDGTAKVWDVRTGQSRLTLTGHSNAVWCAAFSPDGKTIATGSSDHTVRLWDADTAACIRQVAAGQDVVMCVAFSPDGWKLAYAGGSGSTWTRSADNAVRIVDLPSGESRTLSGHTHCVSGIAFHPDGYQVATASWDGTAGLGDARSDTALRTLFRLSGLGALLTVAFSPDGRWCAVAGGAMGPEKAEAGVHLIDVATRRAVQVFEGHARMVRGVAFSPDGMRVASTSLDGTLKVWPVRAPPQFLSLEGHDQAVWALAVSPNGQWVATGSLDRTAKLWDLESGRLACTVPVGFPVVSLAFTPEGDRLLTVGRHATAKLWDLHLDRAAPDARAPVGEPVRVLEGHSDTVLCVAVSSQGRYFATGGKDQTARIWDAPSGRLVQVLKGHTDWVLAVAFSPDEARLMTASADRTVSVWEIATSRTLFSLAGHSDRVLQVAWSPDGQRLAIGCQDGTIRLWDAHTGAALLPPLEGHRDGVSSLAFSPDGRRLVTAAGGLSIAKGYTVDNSVFLWDVATGQSLLRLRPHLNVVRAVAFGPDGTRLVTGSADNTARAHSAFAWRLSDDPGDPGASSADRFEHYKRDYWAKFLTAAADATSPRPGRKVETRIFEFNVAVEPRGKTRPFHPIPARDPAAAANQIDLAQVCNVALDEAFLPVSSLDDLDQDWSALPAGLRTLGGVLFDVRGVIQLGRQDPDWSTFPVQAQIPVGRRFRQFHVFQSAIRGELDGAVIGRYRLHYADGDSAELEIRYGRDLRDWRARADAGSLGEHAVVAWSGPPWARAPAGETVRLFRSTYVNPRPDVEVLQIDFVSNMTQSAPLLVAMTVD
jgi:WD40 repeat protein/serine/threonine protein kinase